MRIARKTEHDYNNNNNNKVTRWLLDIEICRNNLISKTPLASLIEV